MIDQILKSTKLIQLLLLALLCCQCTSAKDKSMASHVPGASIVPGEIVELKVLPSTTDSRITNTDVEHLIMYNPSVAKSKLLLFMPGTHGVPDRGPKQLFNTAIEMGYRVINLSYINEQAVARYCRGENLKADPDCAEKFRTQRIFGTQLTGLIPDEPQDAIVSRLVKLLVYLNETDPKGDWDRYLEGDEPKWSIITVTGQSQGGGMAAFIAQRKKVNRIISFSGGWDFSSGDKEIAKWYFDKSVTPASRWFGTYHAQEPMAATIDKTYKALGIPEDHIYPLDLPVTEGRKAHSQGVRNAAAYRGLWTDLFAGGVQ